MDLAATSAALRALEAEYRTAMRQGKDVRALLPGPPLGNLAPSPQLFAAIKLYASMRSPSSAAQFSEEALKDTRVEYEVMFNPFAGEASVVPEPVKPSAAAKHAAEGYWIHWPGVDARENAATLLYFHGGTCVFHVLSQHCAVCRAVGRPSSLILAHPPGRANAQAA